MRCPLATNEHGTMSYCQERVCAFSDEAGDCLVRQALQCYVSEARTRAANENDRLRKETEMAQAYWAMRKDGTRTPISFIEESE